MSYPTTGHEVYVSLNLSNTMLTGIGKGTITREEVSVDYLKDLFSRHGVIVSASSIAVWWSSTLAACAAAAAPCCPPIPRRNLPRPPSPSSSTMSRASITTS